MRIRFDIRNKAVLTGLNNLKMMDFKEFLELAPGGPLVGLITLLGVIAWLALAKRDFFKGFFDMIKGLIRVTDWVDVAFASILVAWFLIRVAFMITVTWFIIRWLSHLA